MKPKKYRYNVINRYSKKEEQWSGVFLNKEDAEKWYERYGREQERNGYKLVLKEFSNKKELET